MARKLEGKKVAILVADGFEQVEMTKPREALDEAGAKTKIVSLKSGKIQGMHHAEKGDKFDVDLTVDQAQPEDFDALMIPGGLMNPDALRASDDALEPSWGKPELMMSLAYSYLSTKPGDVNAAERYAREALQIVPHWHYVRDILLPQIRAAKAKAQ